ncbi:MAG: spore cortex biosynthesis protein YabQ, partial [Clostridia bacterium]|nr:spore cortex biosynthesis protein YabQ [Clostridia bacterium]
MRNHIPQQLLLFGQSLLMGAGLALVYDLLRPLRRRIPRFAWAADALFGLAAPAGVFLFVLRRSGGEPRLYVLAGLLLGSAAFFTLISPI